MFNCKFYTENNSDDDNCDDDNDDDRSVTMSRTIISSVKFTYQQNHYHY